MLYTDEMIKKVMAKHSLSHREAEIFLMIDSVLAMNYPESLRHYIIANRNLHGYSAEMVNQCIADWIAGRDY